MADKQALRFKIGDWIVHAYYGVGEVVDILEKDLDGAREIYFRVSAAEIEYWLPNDKADAEHIHPIRTKKEFDQAIKIMSKPPVLISEPPNRSKRLIYERWLDGSLPARAALLRDLYGRNNKKELSYDEKKTFEKAENYFIDEWIISNPSLSRTQAKQKLKEALTVSVQSDVLEPEIVD
jgi:RNA polymerase-interacting CarD/CdnL/TRCF family regulator